MSSDILTDVIADPKGTSRSLSGLRLAEPVTQIGKPLAVRADLYRSALRSFKRESECQRSTHVTSVLRSL